MKSLSKASEQNWRVLFVSGGEKHIASYRVERKREGNEIIIDGVLKGSNTGTLS